ncbi:collagen alpha-1(I) chain-like [Elephas maximus indicus]|uniref:collagen alpha-1(I) chain-like n=1 Tax=Elephas maximus indicus TaxID=99487 RepID=UPI002116E524|nr:collagen alpha-1(I) chain-like [Elephas maximus indicus]
MAPIDPRNCLRASGCSSCPGFCPYVPHTPFSPRGAAAVSFSARAACGWHAEPPQAATQGPLFSHQQLSQVFSSRACCPTPSRRAPGRPLTLRSEVLVLDARRNPGPRDMWEAPTPQHRRGTLTAMGWEEAAAAARAIGPERVMVGPPLLLPLSPVRLQRTSGKVVLGACGEVGCAGTPGLRGEAGQRPPRPRRNGRATSQPGWHKEHIPSIRESGEAPQEGRAGPPRARGEGVPHSQRPQSGDLGPPAGLGAPTPARSPLQAATAPLACGGHCRLWSRANAQPGANVGGRPASRPGVPFGETLSERSSRIKGCKHPRPSTPVAKRFPGRSCPRGLHRRTRPPSARLGVRRRGQSGLCGARSGASPRRALRGGGLGRPYRRPPAARPAEPFPGQGRAFLHYLPSPAPHPRHRKPSLGGSGGGEKARRARAERTPGWGGVGWSGPRAKRARPGWGISRVRDVLGPPERAELPPVPSFPPRGVISMDSRVPTPTDAEQQATGPHAEQDPSGPPRRAGVHCRPGGAPLDLDGGSCCVSGGELRTYAHTPPLSTARPPAAGLTVAATIPSPAESPACLLRSPAEGWPLGAGPQKSCLVAEGHGQFVLPPGLSDSSPSSTWKLL